MLVGLRECGSGRRRRCSSAGEYIRSRSQPVCPCVRGVSVVVRVAHRMQCARGWGRVCMRVRCICDCEYCGKLFRGVVHGKLQDTQVSRPVLTRMIKDMYTRLEEEGEVEMGTADEVSGISLRAGGVTEAAAAGIERELLAGHGRWKSLSGPEQYDRNDKRKYKGISDALHQSMRKGKKRGLAP